MRGGTVKVLNRKLPLLTSFLVLFLAPLVARADLGWHNPDGSTNAAPETATFVTVQTESGLPNSRPFLVGASGASFLKLTDLGALVGLRLDYNTPLPLAWGGTAGATAQAAVNNLLSGIMAPSQGAVPYFDGTNWSIANITSVSNGQVLGWNNGPIWITPSPTLPASTPGVLAEADPTFAPNGRVLTQGDGIDVTDNGAGSTEVVAVDSTVVRTSNNQSIAGVKTFTSTPVLSTNSITTAAGHTVSIPDADSTLVDSVSTQTITGVKTLTPKLASNAITTSTGNTLTAPDNTASLVEDTATQTLTNKTLQAPIITNGATIAGSSKNYTLSVTNPAANDTITLRDPNGNADFAFDDGTPVANGVKYSDGHIDHCTAAGSSSQVLYGNMTWGDPGMVDPMTSIGDLIAEGSSGPVRVAGNSSATKEWLYETSGTAAFGVPAFSDLSGSITAGQEPSTTVNTVSGGSPIISGSISGQNLALSVPSVTANQAYGNFTGSTAAPSFGTVSVGAGGTGVTSLAGNGVVVMNSGGTAQTSVAPGANGNTLQSNGSTWISAAPSAGFTNPMTTLGDMIYEDSTPTAVRLAGNTSTTRKYLGQTGAGGGVSAAPTWTQPAFSELSGSVTAAQEPSTTVNAVSGGSPIISGSISGQTLTLATPTVSPHQAYGNFGNTTTTPSFGTVDIGSGGTGSTSFTANGIVGVNGSGNALTSITGVASGDVMTYNGATWGSSAPTVAAGSQVTGVLPYAHGGTGASSMTQHGVLTAGASALGTVAPSNSGNGLVSNGTDWISAAIVNSISAGTGIGVSSATGSPTISNTGVTSIVAGTNVTISGGTGAVTINASGGSSTVPCLNFIRGYCVSGSPNADSSGASSTLFIGPTIDGNQVTCDQGSGSFAIETVTQAAVTMSGNTAGTPVAVFYKNIAGTQTISQVAWTNATTPPTMGTDGLGRACKSGDTTSLYVFSYDPSSATTVEDDTKVRGVSNVLYPIPKNIATSDTTTSWASSTGGWAPLDGNTTNGIGRCTILTASTRNAIYTLNGAGVSYPSSASVPAIGVGLNSTSSIYASMSAELYNANSNSSMTVSGVIPLPVGVNYLQNLQNCRNGYTCSWQGTSAYTSANLTFSQGLVCE